MTSGHLITVLAKKGVQHIKLVLRGVRTLKQFDLTLPWFGDDRWKKRDEFEKSSIQDKIGCIMEDRGGGSLTPEQDTHIRALEAAGRCEVIECTSIRSVDWVTPDAGQGASLGSMFCGKTIVFGAWRSLYLYRALHKRLPLSHEACQLSLCATSTRSSRPAMHPRAVRRRAQSAHHPRTRLSPSWVASQPTAV